MFLDERSFCFRTTGTSDGRQKTQTTPFLGFNILFYFNKIIFLHKKRKTRASNFIESVYQKTKLIFTNKNLKKKMQASELGWYQKECCVPGQENHQTRLRVFGFLAITKRITKKGRPQLALEVGDDLVVDQVVFSGQLAGCQTKMAGKGLVEVRDDA